MLMTQTQSTIVQLLSAMSDGKEIRAYLQRFSSVDQTRFAVIKIGGAVLREALEETASALAFLHTVGLTPIVLHGGGPQLDERLSAAGVETPKVDGLRVTSAPALDIARDVFIGENLRLVEAVRAQGIDAHSLSAGVIEAEALDTEKYGLVGVPTRVRLGMIEAAVRSRAVPILTCLGVAPGGQMLNINGDTATRALVKALQPMKIIFLSGTGGLLKPDGRVMSSINLASDYEALMTADWVHSGMQLKLQEIKALLEEAPLSSSVSITSPSGLMKELFTHGGDGTLIRKGERLNKHIGMENVDRTQLNGLVEEAFGRQLKPGWLTGSDPEMVYLSENARAGAVITRVDGEAYLDKFAVLEAARGEGLAKVIWRAMAKDYPVLYWRSRTANGFNSFYAEAATGSIKRDPWTVFWTGNPSFDKVGPMVEAIAALPDSFVEIV